MLISKILIIILTWVYLHYNYLVEAVKRTVLFTASGNEHYTMLMTFE